MRECYPSGGHSEWFDLDENIRKRKNFRLPGIIPVLHQGHYWQLAFEDGEKLDEEYLELERGLALSLLPTYRNGGLGRRQEMGGLTEECSAAGSGEMERMPRAGLFR